MVLVTFCDTNADAVPEIMLSGVLELFLFFFVQCSRVGFVVYSLSAFIVFVVAVLYCRMYVLFWPTFVLLEITELFYINAIKCEDGS